MDHFNNFIAVSKPTVERFLAIASSPGALRCYVISALVLLSLNIVMYLVPHILLEIFCSRAQNLKKKYNANWALVTGASSGA